MRRDEATATCSPLGDTGTPVLGARNSKTDARPSTEGGEVSLRRAHGCWQGKPRPETPGLIGGQKYLLPSRVLQPFDCGSLFSFRVTRANKTINSIASIAARPLPVLSPLPPPTPGSAFVLLPSRFSAQPPSAPGAGPGRGRGRGAPAAAPRRDSFQKPHCRAMRP